MLPGRAVAGTAAGADRLEAGLMASAMAAWSQTFRRERGHHASAARRGFHCAG
jgi:hypothetical protein